LPRPMQTRLGHGAKQLRVAMIPGDGIGPEVIKEAVQVLRTVAECSDKRVETVEFDLGAV